MISKKELMLKLAFGRLLKPAIHRAKTSLYASRKRTADAIRRGRRAAAERKAAVSAGKKPKQLSKAEHWMASRKGQKQMLKDERRALSRRARKFEPKAVKAKPDSKLQESMNAIAGKKPKSAPKPKTPVPLNKSRTNLEKIEGFKARAKAKKQQARQQQMSAAARPDNSRRFAGSRRSSLPGGSKRSAPPQQPPPPAAPPQPQPAATPPPKAPSQPSGGAQKPPPNKPKETSGGAPSAGGAAALLAAGGVAGASLSGRSKHGSADYVRSIMKLAFFRYIRRAASYIPRQLAKKHWKNFQKSDVYQARKTLVHHPDIAGNKVMRKKMQKRWAKKHKGDLAKNQDYQAFQDARQMAQTAERVAVPLATAGVVGGGTLGWALGGSGSKKEQNKQYQNRIT